MASREANVTPTAYSNMKLYNAKLYNDDTLIRNFVPVINSSNQVGLYDLVNNQFYGNSGSGSFNAGPSV